jgi:uroporphyrinogen III methyltransferase/synthase
VVITRARSQAASFAEAVEKLGGEALVFPTIEILPPQSYQPLDDAIRRIGTYHWVVFTSVNGVKSFLARLQCLGQDHRAIGGIKIAAIGPETAKALESASLHVDLMPGEYRAEAILGELDPGEVLGKRILIPRAASARNVLPETLRRWGAEVDLVAAYQTTVARSHAPWLLKLLLEKKVDMITFTSPSTATHFAALFPASLGELLADIAVACIGPITRESVEALGVRVDVVPRDYTIPGLIRAIAEYFSRKLAVDSGS